MERVLGIGGLFFRSRDPKTLARWYLQNLGVSLTPSDYTQSPWQQTAGPTAFEPFPWESSYFGDQRKHWMINFRVADLDAIAEQLRSAGIDVSVDETVYPNGRFARLYDLEGNPVELWEPAARDTLK